MNRVVLDANIFIHASRSQTFEYQPSCWHILDHLLNSGLRVVQNDKLAEEWCAIQSDYVVMWQATMNDSGRLLTHNEPWPEEAALLAACPDEKAKEHIIHDAHVIGLSMVTDRRLVSADNKLRNVLLSTMKRPGCPSALKTLHFVVPHNPKVNHDALTWLQRGAPEDPSLQLGA